MTSRRGQTSVPYAGFEITVAASKRSRRTPHTARPLGQAKTHGLLLLLWCETTSLNCGHQRAFIPQMTHEREEPLDTLFTGVNRRTRRQTCPSATSPTTHPTWTHPGRIPGLPGERLAPNRLSYSTEQGLWFS
jgi:hypothetical protein